MEMFLMIVGFLIISLMMYYIVLNPVYLAIKFKCAPDYIVVKNTYGDGRVAYYIKQKSHDNFSISSVVNYYTEQEAKDEIAKLIKRDLAWHVVKSEVIK